MTVNLSRIRIFFITLIIASLAMNIGLTESKVKSYKNISFSNSSSNKPIKIEKLNNFIAAKYFNIKFDFSTNDKSFSYGNIFQTGNTSEAIRLEFQPLNKSLVLILGDKNQFIVENELKEKKKYNITINYSDDDSIKVFIDGKNKLIIEDKKILKKKYDFKNFLIGTGFNQKRNFNGHINDFEMIIKYDESSIISVILQYLSIFFIFTVLSIYSVRNSKNNIKYGANYIEEDKDFQNQFSFFGFFILFIIIGILLTQFTKFIEFGYAKWISYILVPISSLALFYIYNFQFKFWNKYKSIFFILSLIFFINLIYFNFNLSEFIFQYILIFIASLFIHILYLNIIKINIYDNLLSFYFPNLLLLLFIIFSFSIFIKLPNFEFFYNDLENTKFYYILFLFISITFLPRILQSNENFFKIIFCPNLILIINILFYLFSIYLFYVLSFRHDSLFIPGSEYHWSYYTGVVETINTSGWLLWDTPSQYGFLNIIISSFFDSSSSWQSFYLFQGTLLFLTSTLTFFTLIYKFHLSFIKTVVLLFITLMSLYFADPSFIGPYPFPSSSVVRFIGIYAFIYCSLYFSTFSISQAMAFSLVWIIFFLWSAESALYVTSIYIFIIMAYILKIKSYSNFKSIYKFYFIIPIIFLSISLLVISAFYKFNIGFYPDFTLFFEHAIGYAGGHGYVPFNLFGPGNILLLLYIGIFYNLLNHQKYYFERNEKYFTTSIIMLASIWALGSYYIGRPVPQNITALLPILSQILLIFILINKLTFSKSNYFTKIFSISFFLILFLPILNKDFYLTINNIEYKKVNIENNIIKASSETNNLFEKLDVEKYENLTFYGDSATQPIFEGSLSKFNQSNWLPIPLQLFETPITEIRKEVLIKRYLCRNKPNNTLLLVEKSESIVPRFAKFLKNLSKYYNNIEVIRRSKSFQLYSFSKFSDINCKKNMHR